MKKLLALLGIILLAGCTEATEQPIPDPDVVEDLNETYDFTNGDSDFSEGIADLPTDYKDLEYDKESTIGKHETYAPTLDAYWLTVQNRNSDVFYLIAREIEGLTANETYTGTIKVSVFTTVEAAESVYLKAGLVNHAISIKDVEGNYELSNIDKGNHGEGGDDLLVAGDLGENQELVTETENDDYPQYKVEYTVEVTVTTNEDGSVFLVVGFDSLLEGLNIVGINEITVDLEIQE
ncbi:hypothetical protein RJG79_10200 [Mycoplasmatota bacterium WC44]